MYRISRTSTQQRRLRLRNPPTDDDRDEMKSQETKLLQKKIMKAPMTTDGFTPDGLLRIRIKQRKLHNSKVSSGLVMTCVTKSPGRPSRVE